MSASKELKRFNHLISETDAAYHEMSLKLGLSDSAMKIIYTIYDNGNSCLLRDVCRLTGISKQTVNSALRKLESQEIVLVEPEGLKNKKVSFTEKGILEAQRTAVRMIEAENSIFAEWPEEDVRQYIDLTEKYLISFKEKTSLV